MKTWMDKVKDDKNGLRWWVFKLVSLNVSQNSFSLLVTFAITLRKQSIFVGQEAVILSFTSNSFASVNFDSTVGHVIGNIDRKLE